MHTFPQFVYPVEATMGHRVDTGDMVAVVGKFLARLQLGRLAHDLVALHHEPGAVCMDHHPFPPEERHGPIRPIADSHEVDEGVRLVLRQARSAMVIAEFIEFGGEAGQFAGTGHPAKEA